MTILRYLLLCARLELAMADLSGNRERIRQARIYEAQCAERLESALLRKLMEV